MSNIKKIKYVNCQGLYQNEGTYWEEAYEFEVPILGFKGEKIKTYGKSNAIKLLEKTI